MGQCPVHYDGDSTGLCRQIQSRSSSSSRARNSSKAARWRAT